MTKIALLTLALSATCFGVKRSSVAGSISAAKDITQSMGAIADDRRLLRR